MAPSKAKDPGTFGKQTGENSPLNLKRCGPFHRHTPSTRDYSPLLRILMQLQNVLSLGLKEERTHHSTTDQLFYLSQSIIDGFQEKPHKKTLAVFLDIPAAFDRVWRQKLVHTIQEPRRMWAGVPQDSVLSLMLFLIFMKTIHHHIHPDTNIACYADDIAVWHSHNDITESEKALNTTLKELSNQKSRPTHLFWSNLRSQNPLFKAHQTNCQQSSWKTEYSSKTKRNFLGLKTSNLKSTFCTVIRPVLEYSTPIWTPASISVKRKLDFVQHRAAKIIVGAVSSTNNEKAEQKCGLSPLESRRKLATIKYTNKLR
ncbi:putative RNA-directed DNA polymerase from transposon BS [Trichonephila clavipes]|nr:putative RNA-directed DNA polymerase from transposon BS [Trichonephila clavipes]